MAACQAVERLASQILLNDLALERDAVGAVLCHGRRSFECPTHRSNHFNPIVRPQGPTPIVYRNLFGSAPVGVKFPNDIQLRTAMPGQRGDRHACFDEARLSDASDSRRRNWVSFMRVVQCVAARACWSASVLDPSRSNGISTLTRISVSNPRAERHASARFKHGPIRSSHLTLGFQHGRKALVDTIPGRLDSRASTQRIPSDEKI